MNSNLICYNPNLPEWKESVRTKGLDATIAQWITGQTQTPRFSEMQRNLQRILPSTVGLEAITKLSANTQAWGAYRNQVIYLASNAPKGTEYHEAFHSIYRLMLSDSEISSYNDLAYRQLLQDAKTKNTTLAKLIKDKYPDQTPSDALPLYIEEYLADKFQEYMSKPKDKTSWIGQLFSRLKSFIKGLLSRQKDVSMLFRKIEQGKFVNAPYVRNEFSQEDRLGEIVYKLLGKALRQDSEDNPIIIKFGADETSQIIRDTASYYFDFKNSELGKRERWTDDQIIDKIIDLRREQYRAYSDPSNLGKNEHDYWYLFSEEDIIEEDGSVILGERTQLKREVISYLKNFKRLDELSRESDDDLVDDVGDKSYLNAEMKNEGGWGSLPQFVRQYIAQISYPIGDKFIGYRDEITKEGIPYREKVYQKKALNPTKVYNGLLRALANELSEENMVEKLINYGQLVEYIDENGNKITDGGNIDTHYFVQRFLKDTKLNVTKLLTRDDLDEKERNEGYVPQDDLNANLIYQKILKGFNRWAKNTIFTEIDIETKESRVYLANRKNVAQQQFDQWHNNYNNKDIDRKDSVRRLNEVMSFFQEESPYYQDQEAGVDFAETKSREDLLAEDIGKVKAALLSVGIDVSPAYIKYSLLYPKYKRFKDSFAESEPEYSRDTLTLDEYKFIEATAIYENERLKYQDFTEFSKTMNKGSNPYAKSETDAGIDDANIGRIQNIAKGNAKLDETVFESSYVAADGTVRYLHQDGTYHLKAVGKLRDPKYREQLLTTGLRDLNITVGVREDGTPINIDDIDKQFVLENFLLSNESDFLKIADRLRIEELDGIKSKRSLYLEDGQGGYETDENGNFIVTGYDSLPGKHFGDMTDREFAVTLYNLYGNPNNYELDAKGNKIFVVPQIISVMETSKSSDYVYLPVIKGLYGEDGPTDKLIGLVRNELKKEFDRIGRTYTDITKDGKYLSGDEIQDKLGFLVDAYHTNGAGARGLKVTDKLKSLFTEEFIKELEENGKANINWFNDNINSINDHINNGIKGLINDTLDLLTDTSIIETDNGKVKNNFLSKIYFEGNDNLGLTTNFEQNIGQVTMQQFINTMAFSHLIHGDNALMYKNDGADPYKREKPNNAKIVSFKHNRTIKKLGVTPFSYSRMVILDEPKDTSKIFPQGDKIDQADAQMWGSVQAIRNSLFGLGRLTPDVARLLDKMEAGETLTARDYFDANGEIINQDRFINSFKFVFKDSKRTVKISVVALTKELTSVKVENRWVARPGREELHKMREGMDGKDENGNSVPERGFDFVGPKSAFKTYRANILKGNNNEYDYTQARPELYDNEYFGLQLENPSNKLKITTPTQLLHAIDTEQNDDVLTYLIGNNQQIDIKTVRQNYQQALANKSKVMFEGAKAEMYEIESFSKDVDLLIQTNKINPRLARFQQKAIEGLQANGADPQLLEFFEVQDGQPLYNLNNDLVIEKYVQLYLSHFSKGAFSLKNPGHAVALFSNFSMGLVKQVVDVLPDGQIEWRVVRSDSDEYKDLVAAGTQFKKPTWAARTDSSTDIQYVDPNLSYGDYFVDKPAYNVPEYKNREIVGYYSEAILPVQSADHANLIGANSSIPEAIQYMFGNRIPLQDKHSMLSMKWVDTMPIQYGSTGVFPSEIVQLSGADFDIDKLYISVFDSYVKNGQFYRYGEQTDKKEQFKEYLKWQLKNNKFLKSFITEFKNNDERYGLLEDQLWALKGKIKGIENSKRFKENLEYRELYDVLERALGVRYDEDGNTIKTYDYGDPVDDYRQDKLENKLSVLEAEINAFDPTLDNLEYYKELTKDINETLAYYEYTYLYQAIKKYAPNMPSDVESFDNLYNTGAANNTILKSMFALLTNDHVRNGIADQPATQDYIKTGGNEQSDSKMNPAFGDYFSNSKRYPIDSLIGQVIVKRKNNIGKDNIGIDVSGNVQNSILKKGKIGINNKDYWMSIYSPELKRNVIFNTFAPLREISLETGQEDGRRIMDVTSSKISASTDEAKDGNNARFNLGAEQSQVASILNGLGIPWKFCVALVNQPVFKQASATFKRDGLRTEEESKYRNEEDFVKETLKSLEDMRIAEAEDEAYINAEIEREGSLDHLFTFENLAKLMQEGGEYKADQSVEERVLYNVVQGYAFDMYYRAKDLSSARANIGNILKLNKGLRDYDTLTKALNSAQKLGLIDGEIDKSIPFDARFIFTGDKQYKANTDYVHQTSIAYLEQAKQLQDLAKLNFLSKTKTATEITSRIKRAMPLYGDLATQLEKDLLSFITLAAYKQLVPQEDTFTNELLVGSQDEVITTLFKQLKAVAPNNPLVNYIISNKKRLSDGTTFHTLEANSFTRLSDMQLGNLINGYIELEQNPETYKYAQAIFDYLIVKDGMQFKNKSISKILPAEMFTWISTTTGLAHSLLLADSKEAYLRVASELSNVSPSNSHIYDELQGASEDIIKNTLYDRILGYNQKDLYNRFYHLVAIQPAYYNKVSFIRPTAGGTAMKLINNGYEFDTKGDIKKNIFSLREKGFEVDLDTAVVKYPKFIRSKNSFLMLTELDDSKNPNGIDLPFTTDLLPEDHPKANVAFFGQRAFYSPIVHNKNEQWNQMADLNDLRLVKDLEKPKESVKLEEPTINNTDRIIFGHPGIGKTFVRESRNDIIDFDTDYKPRINKQYNLEEGYKALNYWRTNHEEEWKSSIRKLWEEAVNESKRTGKILVASDMILLREYANDFDKVVTISKDTFINRAKQRNDYTQGSTEKWKENLDNTIKNVDKSKLVRTDKYLSDLLPNETRAVIEAKSLSVDELDMDAINSYEEGDEDEETSTEFSYKGSPFKNTNNSEDNTKRCD